MKGNISPAIKETALFILFLMIFLLSWEFIATNGWVRKEYISQPSAIICDLQRFYLSGELVRHLSATSYEAFMGLFFGSMAGVLTAILLGQSKTLGNILEPTIVVLNSVPQIALAPIYIMFLGIGYTSKIFMASILVFFLVFFSTYGGVKNCEKKLRESAALLGANEFTILFQIILPSITPWIIAGVKAGIGAALIGAIVGEYLGATKGIGWAISFATSYFDITRVMSCIFLLLVLGYICNQTLKIIEKKLIKYQEK